jgi:hypothetical protein
MLLFIGVIFVLVGGFIATQDTQSKIAMPFVFGGIVMAMVWLFR